MPDSSNVITEVKISELPAATQANADDQLEANQAGTTRRITLDQVSTVVADSDQIGTIVNDAVSGAEEAINDPIYAHGADGACGANDLAALDAMLAEQIAELPRLQVWAKTSIDVGSLIPGSDLCDPMPYLQKIFAAFDTPGLQGRHMIFGRQRAWNFQTRPTTGLGPQNQYLVPPQRCILEWQREWDFSTYLNLSPTSTPNYIRRAGTYGSEVPVIGSLVKGARTITVGPGQAAGFVYGQRLILKATTQQTNLIGAFTLSDNNPVPIIGSISGTTLTVTDVTAVPPSTLTALLQVGTEIANIPPAVAVIANTRITAQLTGTAGGLGTYQVTPGGQSVAAGTTMMSSRGYSARSEDVIVLEVSGDTITTLGVLQDNYPSTTQPTLQTYVDEPDLLFINPMAIGPGAPGDDRFIVGMHGRTRVEGGSVGGFPQAISVFASLGGHIKDFTSHGVSGTQADGGINVGDATTGFTVENCTSQKFTFTSSSNHYGVTRDVTHRGCWVNGVARGFSTHNMHERLRYENCTVNNTAGSAFDIRVNDVVLQTCTARNGASNAVLMRPNVANLMIDNFYAENCLTGIHYEPTSAEFDGYPSNIVVQNSRLLGIGGIGSTGALSFNCELTDPTSGLFPVLGGLRLVNNTIAMTDNTAPINVRGKWTSPVIENNGITGGTGVAAIFVGAPAAGAAGDGASNPTIRGNTCGATLNPILLQNFTGRLIIKNNVVIGATVLPSIASGSNLTVTPGEPVYEVTGTTTINRVNLGAALVGHEVTLIFMASVTVTHSAGPSGTALPLLLTGAVNMAATAGDTLVVVSDGTSWREKSRSVLV